jgi:hypothetical protein
VGGERVGTDRGTPLDVAMGATKIAHQPRPVRSGVPLAVVAISVVDGWELDRKATSGGVRAITDLRLIISVS